MIAYRPTKMNELRVERFKQVAKDPRWWLYRHLYVAGLLIFASSIEIQRSLLGADQYYQNVDLQCECLWCQLGIMMLSFQIKILLRNFRERKGKVLRIFFQKIVGLLLNNHRLIRGLGVMKICLKAVIWWMRDQSKWTDYEFHGTEVQRIFNLQPKTSMVF